MDRSNSDLLQRAYGVLPGATLGSFFQPEDLEFIVASGSGPRVTDHAGREYLDFLLGSGPMILGHAHPAVVAAATAQAARGTTYYALNEPSILLAEKIVSASRSAEMVRFCRLGSEATFNALRLARAATGRSKILKFEGGYHGHHDYTMMSTTPDGRAAFPEAVPDSAGIPDVLRAQVLVAPFNDLETTTRIIEAACDEIAAVIVEPGCRLIDPRPGFLEGLRELTARLGIVLVFDEVVTGFRVAFGGAQALYKVTPDLSCYGKIVGGGYPLAAVAGRRDIMALANPRQKRADSVFMSGTLSGNPVAAAAGLATIAELEKPGAYERLNAAGERIRSGWRDITARLGIPAQILGVGPMANLYFTPAPIHDYRSSLQEDKTLKQALRSELLRRGVMANLAAKIYVSLVHTDADIDLMLEATEDSLLAIRR